MASFEFLLKRDCIALVSDDLVAGEGHVEDGERVGAGTELAELVQADTALLVEGPEGPFAGYVPALLIGSVELLVFRARGGGGLHEGECEVREE